MHPAAATPTPDLARPSRRHDLDRLRLIALFLLLIFHCTRPFDVDSFHVKSPDKSAWIELIGDMLRLWRMPLLFAVSGAAVWFALARRSARDFLKDRALRLFLPLVVGMLVVVPPQVYIERISTTTPDRSSKIDFSGSYLEFLPHIFDGVYPRGNLSWHHLWFLAYAGVFSVVLLPLFLHLRSDRGAALRARIGATLSRGWWIFSPAAVVIVVDAALRWKFPTTHNLVNDWANLAHSLVFFLAGLMLVACPGAEGAIVRHRRVAAVLAVVTTAIALLPLWEQWFERSWWTAYAARRTVRGVTAWCWIVALWGYARVHLSAPSARLTRVRDLAYPFYIWHQTVIVVLAYVVLGLGLGASAAFVTLVAASLVVTAAICMLVRLTPLTRVMFGLPWRDRAGGPALAATAPVQSDR